MSPAADNRQADHRRILVVDDEPQITRVLRTSLDAHGYDLRVANDGDTALQIARDWPPDLMITDLSMPVMDGLELCRRFRLKSNAPIIVLSVKGEERVKVQALDAGADDYVTKPFGISELLARVRALLRRGKAEPVTALRLRDLEMDLVGRSVRRGKRMIDLTAREFELLQYLLRHQDQVVSREMLARDIWKEQARYTPLDNVIDVHMVRLRRKIDDGFSTKLLHTVRGVGFVLKPEA